MVLKYGGKWQYSILVINQQFMNGLQKLFKYSIQYNILVVF